MHICSISEDGNYFTDRLRISSDDSDGHYFKKPSIYILRIFFMSDVNSNNTGIYTGIYSEHKNRTDLLIDIEYMGKFLNKFKVEKCL